MQRQKLLKSGLAPSCWDRAGLYTVDVIGSSPVGPTYNLIGAEAHAVRISIEGPVVNSINSHDAPDPDAPLIPEIEFDQNVAPRPEEEIADVARAEPDVEDHGQHAE